MIHEDRDTFFNYFEFVEVLKPGNIFGFGREERTARRWFLESKKFRTAWSTQEIIRGLVWNWNLSWTSEEFRALIVEQEANPVKLLEFGDRVYWKYLGEFWWEKDRLTADDVKAIVINKIRSKKKKIDRAKANIEAEFATGVDRKPISDEVKVLVWQRDRGCCVNCGSKENLEYDHVIPISKGGSNNARNLQLLCENCNNEKGGNIV